MRCACGRLIGDMREYRRCCAAAYAVQMWNMWGREAGVATIERIARIQGDQEADEVRREARELANSRRAERASSDRGRSDREGAGVCRDVGEANAALRR